MTQLKKSYLTDDIGPEDYRVSEHNTSMAMSRSTEAGWLLQKGQPEADLTSQQPEEATDTDDDATEMAPQPCWA
ncbi:hypothetical protein Ancab_002941 [Ancistrocladus abbreviatus]